MATSKVLLIGGGWTATAYPFTYGPFVRAASAGGRIRIACVQLDNPERDDYFGMSQFAFNAAGTSDVYPVFVSPERPLRQDDVDGATGIFVAGGHTPGYHDAIVPSAASWLRELVVIDGEVSVAGTGVAWHVRKSGGPLTVEILSGS